MTKANDKAGQGVREMDPEEQGICEDEIDVTWKPKPVTSAIMNCRGFRFSLGLTRPPQKPDDEPLQ